MIGIGEAGRILLHCHAGCDLDDILAAAHLEHSDLFPETIPTTKPRMRIIATYPYRDQGGLHLYDAVRFDPKDFRPRRADGVWTLDGVSRVLYRLPELQGQTVAYVVEGEKDADRLRVIGLAATTNVGGAGKWLPAYTQQLKAATIESVVILPDNDDPGRKHAEDVARSCHAAGLKVKIVTLPDLPTKGDVSDWLHAGHTKAELVELVKATTLYAPPPVDSPKPTKKPKAEKPKQGRDVVFEDIDLWPNAVNGVALLDGLAATFSTYLALPDHASTALALWTIHAFTFDNWYASPFLAVTSPAKRCGKTLLLIVLGALVPRRLFAANVTPAVLFRTIEKYRPTLLIDEADTFIKDNDELRGVLNSGHTRTTAVCIRAVGDDHDPRAFSTWCPKAIALIGKLPGTLDDRAIEIKMRRRTAGESVARLRQDRIDVECRRLRQQAARWSDDHQDQLRDADPDVPAALHDRAGDCWRPLLAIADAAGGAWPALAREAALALSGVDEDDDIGSKLLLDIRAVFADENDPDVLGSTTIIEKLVAMEDRPWSEWSHGRPLSPMKLAWMLKGYSVMPAGKVRVGDKTVRAYRRTSFTDAWTRYGALEVEQRNNPNESGPELAITRWNTDSECSTLQGGTDSMNTDECSTVPPSEGGKVPDEQF